MFKTLVFAVGLALTAPAAFAQTASAAQPVAKAPQYEHCILVLRDSYYDSRNIGLEFGQSVRSATPNPDLVQANIVVTKLRSVVAALDYMSSQGWECINVSTLVDNTTSPNTGYLLRRAK
jgi:hypothetical protein